MSRVSIALAMVFALAAAPAAAAGFLKLGDIKGGATAASGGKQLEIDSFAWGTTNPTAKGKVEHEWKVEEGESAPPVGGSEKLTVGGGRTEASGQATGKRQHKPLRMRSYAAPLDRGSVTVKGRFPGCRVGARYADAVLQSASGRYELRDVVITSCGSASSSGESLPMEEISFNYAKIEVRGWEKTQE